MKTMIFNALLLAVGVGLVSADFTCPDGKVTCTEGKTCCFQSDSGYSCCDKPDADVIPGIPRKRQFFPNQSLPSMAKPQHSYTIDDFCPNTSGKRICCDTDDDSNIVDCEEYSECCDAENCCTRGYSCCSEWCCLKGYKCGDYFSCKNGAVPQGAQGLAVMVAVALAAIKFARI